MSQTSRDGNIGFTYLFFYSVSQQVFMSLSKGTDFMTMAASKTDKNVCSLGA
jgi:hypothetical protein